MHRRFGRKALKWGPAVAVYALAVAAACFGGAAHASIPGPSGVIHAARSTVVADPFWQSGPASHSTRGTGYSRNWSGYVATTAGKPLTYVTAQWIEPSVTCIGNYPESVVFWVGFDVWKDATVEQGGTMAECDGPTPRYFTWWEMWPTNDIAFLAYVSPGDRIQASVTYKTSGNYVITVSDLTDGRTDSMHPKCASGLVCNRNSAEWIAESPIYLSGLANLPQWNKMVFLDGAASVRPTVDKTTVIAGFPNFPVIMTGADGNRAEPTALGPKGAGFTDKWLSEWPA
jgi:hypothetical protein